MASDSETGAGLKAFPPIRRRAIPLCTEDLVGRGFLPGADGFPLLLEPNHPDVDLFSWARAEAVQIRQRLAAHGGILFRGFKLDTPERFRRFAQEVTPDLLDYNERAAARRQISAQVYTSTEFPADQPIPLHHEMSYSSRWPAHIWFYCDVPPTRDGRTPIADERLVTRHLPAKILEEFGRKKLMYVRTLGEGVDMGWREAFGATNRAMVEDYCRKAGMEFEWKAGDRLKTRAVREATIAHPDTHERLWFNHAHMFHSSNLPAAVRQALREEFSEDDFPRNVFFGDGSPIPDAMLEEIRVTYERCSVRFEWQRGDTLLLDNALASHGREPFEGPRRILVVMAGAARP